MNDSTEALPDKPARNKIYLARKNSTARCFANDFP
jgi:hypothetical protein